MKRQKRLKESVYEIIYDYTSEEGYEETNNVEEFEGTWSELQDYIKQMRRNGCYNIDANEVYEESYTKNDSRKRKTRGLNRFMEGFGLEDAPGLYRRIYKIIRDNHINAEVLDTDDSDDYGFATISIDGDWKHDHLRLRYLLEKAFDTVIWRETKHYPSDDDCYEAEYKVYVADPKDTVSFEESYHINEELSLDDKRFREAVRFCDSTVEDLADELWRRHIQLDDAIDCIKRFYERGIGRRSLLANIKSHIDDGDLEDVIEDVYFTKEEEMNSMKRYFGRV